MLRTNRTGPWGGAVLLMLISLVPGALQAQTADIGLGDLGLSETLGDPHWALGADAAPGVPAPGRSSGILRLRPFAVVQGDGDAVVRAGAELVIGGFGALDPSGGTAPSQEGLSLLIGADTAQMSDSLYLPRDGGVPLAGQRDRLRAGVLHQGRRHSVFYGAAWLGQDEDTPGGSQVVGALRIVFGF
ncbi:MAG: hypothetical protein OIF47_17260 [Marinibacterium sp.]|nr:hypothetical protein [Marinibacterium sp.]